MPPRKLDPAKIRVALSTLERDDLFDLASRAIDLVPRAKLAELVEGFVKLDQVVASPKGKRGLLDEVKRFCDAARDGEYYEDFNVNSKNYMEKSAGTRQFIEEFGRLEGECVRREAETPPSAMREAIEMLFDLLREIDHDPDAILFFADEAGAWQVGADFNILLPVYFRSLARTADAEAYARVVRKVIKEFDDYHQALHIKTARAVATPEQAAALGGRARAARAPGPRGRSAR